MNCLYCQFLHGHSNDCVMNDPIAEIERLRAQLQRQAEAQDLRQTPLLGDEPPVRL